MSAYPYAWLGAGHVCISIRMVTLLLSLELINSYVVEHVYASPSWSGLPSGLGLQGRL